MDALERVELALKSAMALEWSISTASKSPQFKQNNYKVKYDANGSKIDHISKLSSTFLRNLENCKNKIIISYCKKNKLSLNDKLTPFRLPVNLFLELAQFGDLIHVLDVLPSTVQQKIAEAFDFSPSECRYFISLIQMLRIVRNNAAHHSKVWDKKWMFYYKNIQKNVPIRIPHDMAMQCHVWDENASCWVMAINKDQQKQWKQWRTTTAFILLECQHLVHHIDPLSQWHKRVEIELARHPDAKIYDILGFPSGWKDNPQWY